MDAVSALLSECSELNDHTGYAAHPLLAKSVRRNDGHCYKPAQMRIAELLIPQTVREFRDAVLGDRYDDVRQQLDSDEQLVHAEFTAGRGIARAIHHWMSVDVGELLLNAGADIGAPTTRGESPLTMQLRFGTIGGVRFLLERGADPNHGEGGHMPSESMEELIPLLQSYGWDIDNGQLLHDANHGHGGRVQTWLRHGANPNITNQRGQSALHLIAATGVGRDAIRALVEAGAKLDATDGEGRTPFDLAELASRPGAMHELRLLMRH